MDNGGFVLRGKEWLGSRKDLVQPENVFSVLKKYQRVFGNTFTVHDALKVIEIQTQTELIEAIKDIPEFIGHEMSLALQDIAQNEVFSIQGDVDLPAETVDSLSNR